MDSPFRLIIMIIYSQTVPKKYYFITAKKFITVIPPQPPVRIFILTGGIENQFTFLSFWRDLGGGQRNHAHRAHGLVPETRSNNSR